MADASVRDALARLQDRFARQQQGAAVPGEIPLGQRAQTAIAGLGPTSHPAADLYRLAVLWRKARADGSATADAAASSLGPAALAMLAERLGLQATCQQCSIVGLVGQDMPCIIMLTDGSSRLALSLAQDGDVVLGTAHGEFIADRAALIAEATGTVFKVQSAEQTVESEAPVSRAPRAALPAQAPSSGVIAGFLTEAMRSQKPLIVQLVLASLLINVIGLALPLFSMAVFDRVIPHAAFETLWALALGVLLALGLEFCLRHARLKLFDAAGAAVSLSLQGRLVGRLLFARSAEIPRSAGAVMQPVHELEGMAQLAPQLLVSLLVDLPFFIIMIVFLASIAGPVALAPLIGTLLMVGLHVLSHAMSHRSQAGHVGFIRRQMQAVIDAVASQERIRATSSASHFLGSWEQAADQATFSAHKMRYWHGLAAQGSAVIVQAVMVAAIVIGVFRIDASAMTIGALSAAILLVNRAMTPISIVTGQLFRAYQALEAAAAIGPLLSAPVEAGGDLRAASAASIKGRIDLHRVSFSHPGETQPVLRDITLSIRPGERIGIVGKAGCGKSTLLRLMARLHDPVDGRFLVDERDARQFDPVQLRRAISLMPQDAQLVDLSIEDNLVLGLPGVSAAEFERVVRITGVHDFVSKHPSGYSLMVGPGGLRLSGGERQCVSLARALMGRPAMLLLDEPTAALENAVEARLVNELKRELGTTGLVLATHRLPVLALVDRIIWLDGGRVVADGPKEEVFTKFGLVA